MQRETYSYRSDPEVPAFPDDQPLFVFDGDCVLCSAGSRFVPRHDRTGTIRLAPAQSRLGLALYRHYGQDTAAFETNLLLIDGGAWFKSDATLKLSRLLGVPWSLLGLMTLAPRPLRDGLYDRLARNRFRLFGHRQVCYLMEPGYEGRFLS